MYCTTLTRRDIGKSIINRFDITEGTPLSISLTSTLGYVLPRDVGKRLYLVNGVYQIENDRQKEARTRKRQAIGG